MSKIQQFSSCLVERYSLSQEQADFFVESLFALLGEKIESERIVKVKGLGTFKLAEMSARESVDVNTGERITIEGRYKLSFTPENAVRDRINSPFSQFESFDMDEEVDFSDIDKKYEESEPVAPVASVAPTTPVAPEAPIASENPEAPVTSENPEVPAISENPEVPVTPDTIINPVVEIEPKPEPEQVLVQEPVQTPEPEPEQVLVPEPVQAPEPELVQVLVQEPVQAPEPEPVQVLVQEPVQALEPEQPSELENEPEPEPASGSVVADIFTHPQGEPASVRSPFCEEMLKEELHRSNRIIRLLVALIVLVVIVGLCFGGYMLYQMGKESGRRAEQTTAVAPVAPAVNAETPPADSVAKATTEEHNTTEAEKSTEVATDKTTEKEQTPVPETKEENKPSASSDSKPSVVSASNDIPDQTKYNKDARVRTGAYYILGLDREVTVLKGQTLKGISKAYLGDGMECYIEAFNGGIKEVKAGQKVRIPKLKLKKRSKKK